MSKDAYTVHLSEQVQITDSYTATLHLAPEQLRQVGQEAARAAGLPFDGVNVTMEPDEANEASYFFTYTTPRANNLTGATRADLSRELRDRLLAMGDALYPYVRITSR